MSGASDSGAEAASSAIKGPKGGIAVWRSGRPGLQVCSVGHGVQAEATSASVGGREEPSAQDSGEARCFQGAQG